MIRDDIAVIGGGPVGIWGLYHAGLHQARARLIESLPELGGQLTAMYPEKMIYDVAGFPDILARDLVHNLEAQSIGSGAEVNLGEKVMEIHPDDEGWRLVTSVTERHARAVIIATGLGAFKPKTLGFEDEARLVGRGVSYFVKSVAALEGKRIVIIGGGDSAVDWANTFRGRSEVHLVHKLDRFQAHEAAVQEMTESGAVEVLMPWEVKAVHGSDRLEAVEVGQARGDERRTIEADELLICIGFNADLGPLRNWGLTLDRNKIAVDTEMRTNLPGVFAAGDVVTYPGKLGLIALGFGEMAIAVKSAVDHAFPGQRHGLAHSSSRGF